MRFFLLQSLKEVKKIFKEPRKNGKSFKKLFEFNIPVMDMITECTCMTVRIPNVILLSHDFFTLLFSGGKISFV